MKLKRMICRFIGCKEHHDWYGHGPHCARCGEHFYEGWIHETWLTLILWRIRRHGIAGLGYILGHRCEVCGKRYWVPKRDHINCHPHCLHLWRPLKGRIPLPPSEMVGPTAA